MSLINRYLSPHFVITKFLPCSMIKVHIFKVISVAGVCWLGRPVIISSNGGDVAVFFFGFWNNTWAPLFNCCEGQSLAPLQNGRQRAAYANELNAKRQRWSLRLTFQWTLSWAKRGRSFFRRQPMRQLVTKVCKCRSEWTCSTRAQLGSGVIISILSAPNSSTHSISHRDD